MAKRKTASENRLVSVRSCYDSISDLWVEKFFDELDHKPLDRMLLNYFAELTRGQGLVGEIGCGPGEVSHYLQKQGVEMTGLDISPEMIREASRCCPDIPFQIGDMYELPWKSGALAGLVAFYAIVHCDREELAQTMREVARVLRPEGCALISFHIGDEVKQVTEFMDRPVNIEFRFQEPEWVLGACADAGLHQKEFIIRYPYDEKVEYPSQRGYLLCSSSPGDTLSSV